MTSSIIAQRSSPLHSGIAEQRMSVSHLCSSLPKTQNERQGYVQIYFGAGKGKTTAALGLSMRTILTGGSVYFAQFFKGVETAELGLPALSDRFIIEQYGTGHFVSGLIGPEEISTAQRGIQHCADILKSGYFDLVVLDEILLSVMYQILTIHELIALLEMRKSHVEVVVTGRYVPQELLKVADLVTEMKKVKHYYDQGVRARKGIEF